MSESTKPKTSLFTFQMDRLTFVSVKAPPSLSNSRQRIAIEKWKGAKLI